MPKARIKISTTALAKDGEAANRAHPSAISRHLDCGPRRRPSLHFRPYGHARWIAIAGVKGRPYATVLCDPRKGRAAGNFDASGSDLSGRRNEPERRCSHSTIPYGLGGGTEWAAPAFPCGGTMAPVPDARLQLDVGVYIPDCDSPPRPAPFVGPYLAIAKLCCDRRERGRQEWL